MICEEARELIGGDPDNDTPELLAHLAGCPECQAYREQTLVLNAKILRALKLDPQTLRRPGTPVESAPDAAQEPAVPHGLAPASPAATATSPAAPIGAKPAVRDELEPAPSAPTAAAQQPPTAPPSNVTPFRRKAPAAVRKHKSPRLFAFAASMAAALVVGFTLWLSRPPESLAAEIVAHVEGEPNSWSKTQPVDVDHLESVLRKSGVRLGTGMQPVVYASSCWFRGHFVPHFVVSTKDGPVTVMILENEQVKASQQFKEDGYTGLLVPAHTGSVAVLSRTPMALEQPAKEVVAALQSAADQPPARE